MIQLFTEKLLGDALKQMPGIEVVGTANNGKIALSKIKTLKPDLMTLDIEMPEMNGIELLQQLQKMDTPPLVIMVSTLTPPRRRTDPSGHGTRCV